MEKEPITVSGLQDLKAELEDLKNIQRPKIVEAIAEARSHGDLKENAEYHAAREEQGLNEARIRELEEALSLATVVEYKDLEATNIVVFGATVSIRHLDSEKELTYQIVGESEANIEFNTISFTTPIARALIKKSIGDIVEVSTPGGLKEYEIKQIKII